ncbi:tyrosine-type recombinase/integrase [Bradyrhizobium viridifuturi]|uniref:tyrosine-type recombinase/integrase n=1 Tax=Bradyrhizobium viridifuturi TaxID=1654716 RepID=UPI00067F16CC|nr:site-specific integrase [Bradyrhizobium viridifuturi]
MPADVLTVTRIDGAQPRISPSGKAIRTEIPDARQPGLYLIVQPNGKKSWAVRYRHAGRPKKLTLGPYPGLELKKARRLAGNAFTALAEGHDPAALKRANQEQERKAALEKKRGQRDLFENIAREFVERYAKPRAIKKGRPDAWKETARIIGLKAAPDDPDKLIEHRGEFIPHWRGRKVQEITKRDVVERIEKVADRAPIMANRSLAAIRKLFNWAVARDILSASPCAGISAPSPEQGRDRILSDDELRLVWAAADGEGWPFGPIVKLLILTGQREAEVAGIRCDEIDQASRVWNLAARRTKNNERHEVPLSDAAWEIIEAQPKIGSFRFSIDGKRPVTTFSRAKDKIDAAIAKALRPDDKPIPHWTFHDLRRTAVSGMARLGIALPVIEKVINHKSGSFRGVVGVYQRHSFADEKRAALDAWSRFVISLTERQ